MIYYGKREHSNEYFADASRESQSSLKLLLAGLELYKSRNTEEGDKRLHYEEKGHFVLGDAVDTYMTLGKEAFETEFHIGDSAKPSPLIMSMVQHVFDSFNLIEGENGIDENLRFSDLSDFIESAIEAHAYQPKWKMETKIAAVIRDGSAYFQSLIESMGKRVLSEEEGNTVMSIAMAFKSHPHTREYFNPSNLNVDIYYQVPIYSEVCGVASKALLDMVIIDHKEKTIRICDVKTVGDYVMKFPGHLDHRRYDIQGAWYTRHLTNLWAGIANSPVLTKDIVAKALDYSLEPFQFLVESTTRPGTPMIFELSYELMDRGANGKSPLRVEGRDKSNEIGFFETKSWDGYMQAINEYKWYEENGWEIDRKIIESRGVIVI